MKKSEESRGKREKRESLDMADSLKVGELGGIRSNVIKFTPTKV